MKSETHDTINSLQVQWGRRWTFSFICWNCQLWDAILGHIYISHVCIILSKCYFSGHTCRVGVLMVVDTADIAQYPEMFEIYFHVWEIHLHVLDPVTEKQGEGSRWWLIIDGRWITFHFIVAWVGADVEASFDISLTSPPWIQALVSWISHKGNKIVTLTCDNWAEITLVLIFDSAVDKFLSVSFYPTFHRM